MAKLARAAAGVIGATAVGAGAWFWSTQMVETPDYRVEIADADIELRRYPALVVASIDRRGDRGTAVRAGFSPLAGYIFAKQRDGEKIAMTAPVTQGAAEEGWTVSFIMPSGRTLADLPKPGGDVRLERIEPRRMAAVRFSGRWTDENFAEAAGRLMTWVDSQGLTANGSVEYAYYNDPFTPAFLRRNEVMVEIADSSAD